MTRYKVIVKDGKQYQGARAGTIVEVSEPIARTLIDTGVCDAVDKLPSRKYSDAGTKKVRKGSVAEK